MKKTMLLPVGSSKRSSTLVTWTQRIRFSPSPNVDHSPSNLELRGIENIKKSVSDWHAIFYETHTTVEDVTAVKGKVALRWITRSIHQEELLGISPTGRQTTAASIGIFLFLDEEIVES